MIELEDIDLVRTRIREIDTQILRLLGERFTHVRLLGRWKALAELPIENPDRDQELRADFLTGARRAGLDPDLVLQVLELVLERSRAEQHVQAQRERDRSSATAGSDGSV